MIKTTQPTRQRQRFAIGLAALVLIILVVGFVLDQNGTIHIFHKRSNAQSTQAVTADANTKGESPTKTVPLSSPASTEGSQSSDATQPGDQKTNTGGTVEATLLAPTGDFVSNHYPGQNGSPDTETSVCNTTPGAKCQIVFTQNGITKSLLAETADLGGGVYWNNWDPSEVLTPGSWQVQAVATLNGQTKTATDALQLVVSQ